VDNRVRLPIQLVMEVERQPVVTGICGERQDERDERDRAEEQQLRHTEERRFHRGSPCWAS
jgi:hypothetical protein